MVKKIELNSIESVLATVRDVFDNTTIACDVVSLEASYGRALYEDIICHEPIPAFPKSTVDGYAVKSSSTPCSLKCAGRVDMGSGTSVMLHKGECIYVPTGAMLPQGTDTMVMIEDTTAQPGGEIAFEKPSLGRDNIIEVGSDMHIGQVVLKKGSFIGAHEIGALAALGHYRVMVSRRPKVTLIATGDELVDKVDSVQLGQIREINTYTLSALCAAYGLEVVERTVLSDQYDVIRSAIKKAILCSDLVLVSGGSSVGEKDYTQEIMDEVCSDGVIVAGMAIKPGKPTLIAKHNNVPVIGLPGHPVSTIVVFKLVVAELLKTWGIHVPLAKGVDVVLSRKVYAAKGRDTYQMLKIKPTENGFVGDPTSGKSGMITLLTESNGYVVIPAKSGAYEAGAMVRAYYF